MGWVFAWMWLNCWSTGGNFACLDLKCVWRTLETLIWFSNQKNSQRNLKCVNNFQDPNICFLLELFSKFKNLSKSCKSLSWAFKFYTKFLVRAFLSFSSAFEFEKKIIWKICLTKLLNKNQKKIPDFLKIYRKFLENSFKLFKLFLKSFFLKA